VRDPVYVCEEASRLVPMSRCPPVHYRVFRGIVNWGGAADNLERVVSVLIQRGSAEDWEEAKGEIEFRMPAHVLPEDVTEVTAAMESLADRAEVQ